MYLYVLMAILLHEILDGVVLRIERAISDAGNTCRFYEVVAPDLAVGAGEEFLFCVSNVSICIQLYT
jgi:hypothetical protein